ncbi:MAG: radical SAM protein [Candidatus Aureabacteria bacterium]|nr:radical SAM protein [Candidatus Auribacterota bacterium]
MKILFIYKIESFIAPLGPMVISAIARKAGHETFLCDMRKEDPLARTEALNPDIVAYSSSTGESKHYLRLNVRIKERFPELFTIMGGPHPTFFPRSVMESTLDAVCVGEGEGAFRDLLNAISAGKAIAGIPNVVSKGETEPSSVRDLVADLDSLPLPDYPLFYDATPMGRYPLKSFMAGRGCPYRCTYCFNASWRALYRGKGNYLRRHSVGYVIEDILAVRSRWPLSCVKFYDDIFCYKADAWLDEFSREYRDRLGIPFFILTRADLLTEEMAKLLKHAGCRTISMSIEAGNPDIRNNVLGRNMTDGQILDAYRLCEKYGIYTFTNCIVGLPESTIEKDVESVDLSIKAKATWAEFPIFFPYPGTKLGDRVISMGMYSPRLRPDAHRVHVPVPPLLLHKEGETRTDEPVRARRCGGRLPPPEKSNRYAPDLHAAQPVRHISLLSDQNVRPPPEYLHARDGDADLSPYLSWESSSGDLPAREGRQGMGRIAQRAA